MKAIHKHIRRRSLYMFNDEHFLQEIIILLQSKNIMNRILIKINFNIEIINVVVTSTKSIPCYLICDNFLPTVDGRMSLIKL